ncbi:MAG: hypothetical protein SFV22_12365 [Saprospiraceae bacterium]|nr:hypothetical protein [Saprospiraceae bacterium]
MDTKLTDKGWSAMRKLLDKEMPEKPRRRIFGWWWLGLLLLPLAGYGSWYWQHQKEQTGKNKAIASRQAAFPDPIASTRLNTAVQPSPAQAADIVNSTSEGTNTRPTAAPLPIQPNITDFFIESHATNLTAALMVENIPQSIENTSPAVRQTLALKCINIDHFREVSNQSGILPSPAPCAAEPIQPADKTSNRRWAFGAITAVSSEQFNRINGFSTGVNVDWKFARKWGLRTGFAYNIHSPQNVHRPVASVTSDAYASNVDGGVVVVDISTGQELVGNGGNPISSDSLGNSVLIPVRRLERLEVPISVFWQPFRPVKLFSGLSLIRTLSTKADRENYSGNYVLRLNDQVAEADVSKLSSNELDKWSACALFGAGFQVGKSFEVGLTAKLPFNPYSNTPKSNYDAPYGGSNSYLIATKGNNRSSDAPMFSLYGTLFF